MLLLILFVALSSTTGVFAGIPLIYTPPVCATAGGTTSIECSFGLEAAIHAVFIGRDTEGACGWNETTELDCSQDITEQSVLEMLVPVYADVYERCANILRTGSPCELRMSPIETTCGDTAIVRLSYYCWENRIINQNRGQITYQSGCRDWQGEAETDFLFECPSSTHTVNIRTFTYQYIEPGQNCERTNETSSIRCAVNSSADWQWLRVQQACLNEQSCDRETLTGDNGLLYGCTDLAYGDIETLVIEHQYICEDVDMFETPSVTLPAPYSCIGMDDGPHAVVFYGRIEGTVCWANYTDCLDEEVQEILYCEPDSGFDENTQSCQLKESRYCSVGVPVVQSTSISSIEIDIDWSIDDTPQFFTLTINDTDYPDIDQQGPNADSYSFTGLIPNTWYSFSVSATKQQFESEAATTENITYPEDPTGGFQDVTITSATVSYIFDYTAAFVVITLETATQEDEVQRIPADSNDGSLVFSSLEGGLTYDGTITLEGDTGLLSLTPYTLSFFTDPWPPENLTSIEETTTTISLEWDQRGFSEDLWRVSVDGGDDAAVSETSFLADSLTPGTLYDFSVVHVVQGVESSSVSKEESTYPAPADFTSIESTYQSVDTTWSHTNGNWDSFLLTCYHFSGIEPVTSTLTVQNGIFENLDCGKNYTLGVTAEAYGKYSTETNGSFTTNPVAPVLTVDAFDLTTLSVSWGSTSCDPSLFYLYRSPPNTDASTEITSGDETSFDYDSLTPGQSYHIEIRAAVTDYNSELLFSTADPRNSTVIQTLIPLPPVNTQVTNYDTRNIDLSWEAPTGVFSGFWVYNENETEYIDAENVFEYTLQDLKPGSLQFLSLITYSSGPDSTQNSSKELIEQRLRPDPPDSSTVESKTNISAVVTWLPPSEGIYTTFQLIANSFNPTILVNETFSKSDTQVEIESEKYGENITYRIWTYSYEEKSLTSETGFIILHPADPVNFTVADFQETILDLTWDEPLDYVGGYNLVLKRLDESEGELPVSTTDLEYQFADLAPGGQYRVTICVYSPFQSDVESLNCAEVEQMLKPVPPHNLKITPIDKRTVLFTWDQEGSASRFEVSYLGQVVSVNEKQLQIPAQNDPADLLTPANNYTFSVLTVRAASDESMKSDSRSTIGWPYPDDVIELTPEPQTSLSDGSVTLDVSWELPLGNFTYFSLNFTLLPYDSDVSSEFESVMFSPEFDFNRNYSTILSQDEVSFFNPGAHVQLDATAFYLTLESQVPATVDFYFTPIAPVLSFVEGERGTTFIGLIWQFLVAGAQAEYFQIRVLNSTDSEVFDVISQLEGFSTQATDLTPGQLYDFQIRSQVNSGQISSEWSNIVVEPTYPEVPLDANVDNLTLILSWSKPVGIVENYLITSEGAEDESLDFTTVDTELALDNNDFVAGRLYTYNIFAESNNLTSLDSAVTTFAFPPNDVNFTSVTAVEPADSPSCLLEWDIPEGDHEKFIITSVPLSSQDTLESFTQDVAQGETSDLVEELTSGAAYRFEIVAYSNGKTSETPGTVQIRKRPVLTSIDIESVTTASADCVWDYTGIVDSFTVQLLSSDLSSTLLEQTGLNSTESSFSFEDLTAGESYNCRVQAVSGESESEPLTQAFTLYPLVPDVNITYFGTYNLSAQWKVSGGVFSRYDIILDGCEPAGSSSISWEQSSYYWDNLEPGNVCRVRVWAVTDSAEGGEVRSLDYGEDQQRLYPATPGNLAASSATLNSVEITWTQDGFATEYELKVNGSDYDLEETLSGDTTSYTLTGLEPTNEYTLVLDAISGSLYNWVPAELFILTRPLPPVDPAVTPISDTELEVTWTGSGKSKETYQILRNDTGPNNDTTQPETILRDTGLTPGTDYRYSIRALYGDFESEYVDAIGYTYPAVPFDVRVLDLGNRQTSITWSVTPNFESFRLTIIGVNSTLYRTVNDVPSEFFLIENLTPGEEYEVRVESKYKDLYSQGYGSLIFETGCYPIGQDHSRPWKVAFWLTFIYAVLITALCGFVAYILYTRRPPPPPPPAYNNVNRRYIITASPLDGTKWQKNKEFQLRS